MGDIYKITETWINIWIKDGPGVKYSNKGIICGKDKKTYEVTERKNKHWLKIPSLNGWCCEIDSTGNKVMKMVQKDSTKISYDDQISTYDKQTTTTKNKNNTTESEESYAYVPDYSPLSTTSSADFSNSLEQNFTISNIRGIFGMPYQFMNNVDTRITDSANGIGRKYANEIVSYMPLLLITPGVPIFMSTYSDKDKSTILGKLISEATGFTTGINDTVLSDQGFGKYYSLQYAYKEYFEYVNPMCRIAARYMNLQNVEIDGTKLDSFEWSQHVNENFSKLFSIYHGCTAWYCESENNISDSFSNGTTESMIASKINDSASSLAREANFLLGTVKSSTGKGALLDKFINEDSFKNSMGAVENIINDTLGHDGIGGIFSSLAGAAKTVASGGKLVFPELWSESSFQRSYNISLKLVSPDGDDLSIYLNIIVPMLHLLALALPRQADDNADGYSYGYISPFLVRAFYKGFFNVDMGIITDLTFSKGTNSAWNSNGVPTIVDVNFTIKDLYSDLYMSSMKNMKNNMLKNISLMDYIGNMCGININEVDVFRGIEIFFTQNVENRVKDLWRMKIWGSLDQFIFNKYTNIFSKF